jgi:Tfp pilus assembly protein PilE
MVVVLILGILVSITAVAHSLFLKKAKAVEAETALYEVNRLEQLHYAVHGQYSSDLGSLGFAPKPGLKYYAVDVQLPSGTKGLGYQATANPAAGTDKIDLWVLTKYAAGPTTLQTIPQSGVTRTPDGLIVTWGQGGDASSEDDTSTASYESTFTSTEGRRTVTLKGGER